jgi:hypothetical protein
MRVIRGWRWWERVFGALCGALAAVLWMKILLPPEYELKPRAVGARLRAARPVATGGAGTPLRQRYSGPSQPVHRGRGGR